MIKRPMPDTVYKYRCWKESFHKNILLYNELFMASPKDFNDPFDCRIPPNFVGLSKREQEEYINDLIKSQKHVHGENHPLFIEAIANIRNEAKNPEKFQKRIEEKVFVSQDKYYGILSLSCRWNSILMWSIYGDNHKGFCVGFKEEQLRKIGFAGRIKMVEYNDSFPNLKPFIAQKPEDLIDPIFIQIFTKSKDWEHEHEYRFIKNYFDSDPLPFERLIYINNDVFAEVILGINISNSDRKEILKICKFKNIPTYQAFKVPFKFEIGKKPII